MQTLVSLLFVLSFFMLALQMSLIKRKIVYLIWLIVIAGFIYISHPKAIELSHTHISILLADKSAIENFMVIQIIEAICGIMLSIYLTRLYYGEPVKKIFRYLKYFPGIILFPAVFYSSGYVFINIVALNFKLMAFIISIAIPTLFWVFHLVIKKALPEFDLRIELKFVIHVVQLLLAVIISILAFSLPVMPAYLTFHINQLLTFIAAVLCVGAIGLKIYDIKMKGITKKLNL